MSGRIPREFIDDLLTRVDIVEVIGRRLALKKKGQNHWACCPFHGEKSPSFSVSQPKQFYKCFGCGVSGNAISFVMEHDHCDFVTAIETLADIAGVEVPRDQTHDPQAALRTELYALLAEVSVHFQTKLGTPEGAPAKAYLERREVSGEVIQRYGLGAAPPGWDLVLKAFGTDARRRELLAQAGLLQRREAGSKAGEGFYDFFRERLMFPVRDARGRTIAFGGRVMDKGEPKYLNSPETPVFHKGSELYGLFEAKQARAIKGRVLLVEGYMDVVALAQYGINYAVAALGTAATKTHLETLFKLCPEIVCCFDGDKAGRGAAWRALNHALGLQREGRQVRFLFLPDGEDPDSMVRKEGKDNFERRIETQAQALSTYLFAELAAQTDGQTIDGKARLAALVKPLLAQVEDPIYKSLLEQELVTRIGLHREPPPVSRTAPPKRAPMRAGTLRMTPMRTLMALLLQYPALHTRLPLEALTELAEQAGGELLAELCAYLHDHPQISTGHLLAHWQEHEQIGGLIQLAGWEVRPSTIGKAANDSAAEDSDAAPSQEQLWHMFDTNLDGLLLAARQQRAQDHSQALEARIKAGTASAEEKAAYLHLLAKTPVKR